MIFNYQQFIKEISEKQLNLFPDLTPTDTDIANTFINKHKGKTFNRPTSFGTLEDGFKHWSEPNFLNDIIFDEISEADSIMNSSYSEVLINNQSEFIDYIIENPDKSTNERINSMIQKYQNNNQKLYREIESILDEDDWYWHLDNFVSDSSEFEEKLLKDNKGKLFQISDKEFYDDLEDSIYDSERKGNTEKMLVYRAVTLPESIENLEELQRAGVGVYWTYDFDKAEAYWSEFNKEFILSAYANVNCIDWETTVHHTLYGLRQEREVRMYDGADLELVGVFLKDFYEKQDLEDENQKISKMFKNSNNNDVVRDYVKGKYKNMSTLKFEPPVQVVA